MYVFVLFRDEMQKDELIQLHVLFLNIKEKLERLLNDATLFDDYQKLGVYPTEIHKTKEQHKIAVLTLAKKFAAIMADEKNSELDKIAIRLAKMIQKDIEKQFTPRFPKK